MRAILKHEATPGVILLAAAVLALIFANSPLGPVYSSIFDTRFNISVGEAGLDKPLLLWINDGLMAVFFLLVGLEIKREALEGSLRSPKAASLAIAGALGGMVLPALIYTGFNMGDATAMRGWAIPAATDIAFALGVLALLGSRVPTALKAFLLALAIIDDLGAILIIAIFYTAELSGIALILAAFGIAALILLNRLGIKRISPYLLIGAALWVCVLKSGVHATLAGVVVAFCIPNQGERDEDESPLHHLEHAIAPWSAYFIMPVFAFANAGVALAGVGMDTLVGSIPAGIALGLFLGKQIGIFGFAFVAVKTRLAYLPKGVNWAQIYGVGMLGGIGFTMSLFIGTLAFNGPDEAAAVRIGVLGGSLISGVVGYLVLRRATRTAPSAQVSIAE